MLIIPLLDQLNHIALLIPDVLVRHDSRTAVRTARMHSDDVYAATEIARFLVDHGQIARLGILVFGRYLLGLESNDQERQTDDREYEKYEYP